MLFIYADNSSNCIILKVGKLIHFTTSSFLVKDNWETQLLYFETSYFYKFYIEF